jgi:hypothetical protein
MHLLLIKEVARRLGFYIRQPLSLASSLKRQCRDRLMKGICQASSNMHLHLHLDKGCRYASRLLNRATTVTCILRGESGLRRTQGIYISFLTAEVEGKFAKAR